MNNFIPSFKVFAAVEDEVSVLVGFDVAPMGIQIKMAMTCNKNEQKLDAKSNAEL
jgi:hypothetical protein